MADHAEIVLEGWVDKRGSRLHGWKRRYARLTFDRVVFSQDEHSEPRGHWALRDFLAVIKEATRFRQHPNCLCLVHPTSSNRYFEPSTEAHLWLDCIQSLLQHTTPQIVLTRRVQRWLDQAAAHVTQGSLDMDATTPQIPDQPHVDTSTSSAPTAISTADDPNRKRGMSHSSVHTILDASPAVGTLNAQMDPTAWKPAGGRKMMESGLDIVDEDPPLDDLGVRSVGSMEHRSQNQHLHHGHHHQETHDDDDDEVDIRPDDDDDDDDGGANQGDHRPSQALPKSPRNYAVPHGDS